MWKKIDPITQSTIPHLMQTDYCIFARDYISNTGYTGGPTNDLILNFKKPPGAKGQSYRNAAVRQFAMEASLLIDCDNYPPIALTAIPSSKAVTDPAYTKRFEDMMSELKKLRPCVQVEWPVAVNTTVATSRHGGTRKPSAIASNYIWNGFSGAIPANLWVFDDVLVTGSHFRAFHDFARASGYQGNIYGIFWAKR